MPGNPSWSSTWSFPSLQEPTHSQRAQDFAHVRVLPPKLSYRPLSFVSLATPHRVCIRDVKESFSVRPRFPDSFEYLVLDVQDSEEQNLIRLFPRFGWHIIAVICTDLVHHRFRAQQFINAALSRSGRVLVHCNGTLLQVISDALDLYRMVTLGGISLSPAFVIMFAMQHYQLSWEDALHLVQNRRYCISPNGGFLTQIKVCAMNDAIFVGRIFP